MKITKSIIDESLRLVGFFCKGKPSEFGEFGNEEMEKAVTLQEMAKVGFRNKQIEVSNNGLVKEVNGFKISQLPMTIFNPSDTTFTQFDNTINLVKRILVNGELKGFDVSWFSGGNIKRYTYDNVVRLTSWFNPGNFVIRRAENGKAFIAGKPGVLRIADLPEEEIGNNVDTGKRKRTSNGAIQNVKGSELKATGNLLDLYDLIRSCDGLVIKLPDESYKSNTVAKEKVAAGFTPLGVGEIGSAYINFGDKKLNANTTFKNVGTVVVDMNNMPMPVYTFTWSTKSIFANGKNHIKRFGVGVTREVAEQMINTFGKALIVKQISDKKVTEPIVSLTGKKEFVFFEVDTSAMEVMSEEKAKNSILDDKTVFENVKRMIELKANIKVIKEYLKELEAYPLSKTGVNKPLFGLFASMNNDALAKITEAGVDVYTGAYIKKEKADTVTEKAESAEKAEDNAIEVEYDIAGYSLAKFKRSVVEEIVKGNETAPKYCTAELINAVKKINSYKTPKSKMALCEEFKENAEKELNHIRMLLWLHKMAMYKLGNGSLAFVDKSSWETKASRAKKSEVYACKTPGTEGLCIKLTNVTIK